MSYQKGVENVNVKKRVIMTEKKIEEVVKAEAKRHTEQIYAQAHQDVSYQVIAVLLCVLHREFGFGKERLTKVKNLTEHEFMAMRTGILGKSYTTNDCVKFLKENYGIDFAESQYEDE